MNELYRDFHVSPIFRRKESRDLKNSPFSSQCAKFLFNPVKQFLYFQFQIQIRLDISKQDKVAWEETKMYKWQGFQDNTLKRMFKKYSELGVAALPDDKYQQLMRSVSGMEANYATSKICSYKDNTKCDLALEPGKTYIYIRSYKKISVRISIH